MSHSTAHDESILDQFSRQAVPFSQRHRADDELMALLIECSGVQLDDRVLDVACGPGMVACALAHFAGHVTGLDFTPAMLERAAVLQAEKHLHNLDWRQGSATALPFEPASFDVVVTRFSFHHFLNPAAALREMARVCRPDGTIMVCDVAPAGPARDAYDTLEKHRDPSHTRALTEPEFERLGEELNLNLTRKARYELESDVEGLLASSFPPAGGAEAFRAAIGADIAGGQNQLGIGAHRRNGAAWFYFPILIATWEKP